MMLGLHYLAEGEVRILSGDNSVEINPDTRLRSLTFFGLNLPFLFHRTDLS
jgi:hypothetical protein